MLDLPKGGRQGEEAGFNDEVYDLLVRQRAMGRVCQPVPYYHSDPELTTTGLVFVNAKGRPIDPETLRKEGFKPALVAAGLPTTLRIHDLRGSFASMCYKRNVSMDAIASSLFHKSPETTRRFYTNREVEQTRQAPKTMQDILHPKRKGKVKDKAEDEPNEELLERVMGSGKVKV
jgi:integrase